MHEESSININDIRKKNKGYAVNQNECECDMICEIGIHRGFSLLSKDNKIKYKSRSTPWGMQNAF